MADKKFITTELDFVKSFKLILQAYEEISTMKMKKVRGSVIDSRAFLESLARIYAEVKGSYKKRVDELLTKRDKASKKELATLSAFKKNGKSLLIFISANTKLYGDIMIRVFNEFKVAAAQGNNDIMIVGKLGRSLYEESGLGKNYLYFEIPDLDLQPEDLKQIVYHLVQYDSVNIFHGRFENIVTQTPYVSSVSGDRFFKTKEEAVKHESEKYLFEPSLPQILGFFEAQVFTSLFQQSVYEGALARFASRIKAMEQALERIESTEKELYQGARRIKKLGLARQQGEKIAGMALWR